MIEKILLKFKSQKGYTLVELLAVIVIMVVTGIIIATIVVSSLRGGNKTSSINEIRDNGNTAMTRMSRAIEFAKSFEGVSLTGEAGSYFDNCVVAEVVAPTPTPVPSHFKYLKIRSFDRGVTIYSCANSKISSNSAALINDKVITVDSDSCYFTCRQSYLTQPPTISINFTLTKGVNSLFFEQKYSTDFHTSVVMRNLGP